ncbi:MAG: mannose-1-phosphate guanylyltransferase [Nannocystis sp.]|nr:mannose-1-phosphate guanylyltransferase [Nannocystis sp.]MBA3546051.1 mannose-1-phosphate guanylyltransferase [Nannocystis sp.]
MAGGGGTRLWPASTAARPKQLLHLSSRPPHTLLAAAVERARRMAPLQRIYVVTSIALAPAVQAAVPELLSVNVIPEPRPRSTAPCVALAVLHVREDLRRQGWSEEQVRTATVIVLPADHHIGDIDSFTNLLTVACEHSESHGEIVTLGVQPRRPSTGFGYIERGPEPLARRGEAVVYPALRFIEKPDAARAQIFVDAGCYLWNAGIFVMPMARIIAELERHATDLWATLAPVARALATAGDAWSATVTAYDQIMPEAIDVAVMEKQRDLCVVPMRVPWTDLGSWDALHEALPHDDHNNVTVAPKTARTELVDTKDSLVWSEGLDVTLLGMTGVAVVVSGGRVLVCPLDRAEEVRRLARRS